MYIIERENDLKYCFAELPHTCVSGEIKTTSFFSGLLFKVLSVIFRKLAKIEQLLKTANNKKLLRGGATIVLRRIRLISTKFEFYLRSPQT